MVVNGRVQVGFVYPPLQLIWTLPGYLLGDVRYSYILAIVLSAMLFFAQSPNARSLCAALGLLLNPLTFWVENMCWNEPLVLLMIAATVYAARKQRKWLPFALGLFLASKQYNVLALPFIGCLLGEMQPFRWKSYWKLLIESCVVAAATLLPFAIWNPRALWHDLILYLLALPFRTDSLSFARFAPIVLKIGPFLLLAFLAWGVRACKRNPAMFAAGYAIALLIIFPTAKAAFCNYYFLIAQLFLLSASTIPGIRIWRPRMPIHQELTQQVEG
jgi:hypothetical protein